MLSYKALKFINAGALTFTMVTTLIFLKEAWQCTQMTHFKAQAQQNWQSTLEQMLAPIQPQALDNGLQGAFMQMVLVGFGGMALGLLLKALFKHPSVQQPLHATLARWKEQNPPALLDHEKAQLVQQHRMLNTLITLPLGFAVFLWAWFWSMAHLAEIVTYIDLARDYFQLTHSKIGMQVAFLQGLLAAGEFLVVLMALMAGHHILKVAMPWYGNHLKQRPTRTV